jgi:hypothetical protein
MSLGTSSFMYTAGQGGFSEGQLRIKDMSVL